MPILRRYFYAASGRPGRRCFPARFGAAKRQNGETAAPVRRPQRRGAGCRERRYSHAVSRRYFHARFGAVFSCPFRGGIFMPILRRYFPARFGAVFSCRFGAVFSCRFAAVFSCRFGAVFSCLFRGGETAKRPRRCAARREGARAAGRGGMIFRAAKIARKQGPRAGPGEGAGFPGAPVRRPQTRARAAGGA